MNKRYYVKQLSEKLNIDQTEARRIADVIDDCALIGRKNKDNTISTFMERLNVTKEEANKLYNVSVEIIKDNIINKIKHPFKKDN